MSNLQEYLNKVLIQGADSDDEGKKVERKAHKILLKRSPYFEGLFNVEGKEQQTATVELDNISDATMAYVLNYLYTDALDIPLADCIDVAIAADYLQLDVLRDQSVDTWVNKIASLPADKVASSLDEALKHKLINPKNIKNVWTCLASNASTLHLPNLSELFLEALIGQLGHLKRQCLYWLESWAGSDEARIETAKKLLDKLDLCRMTHRDLLEVSKSSLLSTTHVLDLLRKKAKREDDGCAKLFQFEFTSDAVVEFEYEGTHWLLAFSLFSATQSNLSRTAFEFFKGDPDARLTDIKLKTIENAFLWTLGGHRRAILDSATPWSTVENIQKGKMTLVFKVAAGKKL